MKGLCLSALPSPTSIFRFFHLPLGQSLIFLPVLPPAHQVPYKDLGTEEITFNALH